MWIASGKEDAATSSGDHEDVDVQVDYASCTRMTGRISWVDEMSLHLRQRSVRQVVRSKDQIRANPFPEAGAPLVVMSVVINMEVTWRGERAKVLCAR